MDASHPGSDNNWENDALFGSPSGVEDYKSPAYVAAPMMRLRVDWNGLEVAETTSFGSYGCEMFSSQPLSLQQRFRSLAFRCTGEDF